MGLSKLTIKETELLNNLVLNSKIKSLKYLYLHGEGKMGTIKIRELLSPLLKVTKEQIYIDSFKLTEMDMSLVFSKSTKAKELCLINCNVSNLGEDFKIPDRTFVLESLDLHWTCIEDNDEYLDLRKAKVLMEAIANSQIAHTLQRIHLWDSDFAAELLEEMLEDLDLDVDVDADDDTPEPLD